LQRLESCARYPHPKMRKLEEVLVKHFAAKQQQVHVGLDPQRVIIFTTLKNTVSGLPANVPLLVVL
jgi:ERCC4-related helicase